MHQPLKLPAGRVALVLVDLQEEHRQDPRYLVESYDRVLGNAARLMAAARSSGVPVIHAAYVRDFDDVPPRPFEPVANGAPVFSVRGDGTKICAEVEPAGGETVIEKNDASCFVAQEFEAEIAKLAPDWLVVAGVWTEACIAATVRDAVAQGLRVLLVKDACGSGTESMHQSALIHLANRLYGGAISDMENTVDLLLGREKQAWQLVGSTPLRFSADTMNEVYSSL